MTTPGKLMLESLGGGETSVKVIEDGIAGERACEVIMKDVDLVKQVYEWAETLPKHIQILSHEKLQSEGEHHG